MLAFARAFAVEQGADDDRGNEHGHDEIRIVDTRPERVAVRVAGEVVDAGEGLQIVAEAEIVGVRPGVALLGGIDDDDIGLDPDEVVVVQAPFAHGPACKAVDHHIANGHEALGDLDALGAIQVERDAVFAAVKIIEKATAIEVRGVIAEMPAAQHAE